MSEKNYMPQSTAGLIRYYEETSESKKIKPEHVVFFSIGIIGLELAIKFIFV